MNKQLTIALIILGLLIGAITGYAQIQAAGTVISNQAKATYSDPTGVSLTTLSNTVTTVVSAVAGVQVTPDETAPTITYGPLESQQRDFQICNSGNIANQFKITSINVGIPATFTSAYIDVDGNGLSGAGDIPITIGTTLTPTLQPGQCSRVIVLFNTGNGTVGASNNITLTAETANPGVNGIQNDIGTRIHANGEGPKLTDPRDKSKPPVKTSSTTPLADPLTGKTQEILAQGQDFTYYVTFQNKGGANAVNVLFQDDLPTGITYTPGSLKLDGIALTDLADADAGTVTGSHLEIKWASIAIDQKVIIEFKAKMGADIPGMGLVNQARFTASNLPEPVTSNPHVAILTPIGIVYAGRAGGSSPIGNATVILATDPAGTTPLNIPNDTGFDPNLPNKSTFLTSANGSFNFTPGPGQIGAPGNPARYYIISKATAFTTRVIEITITPAANGLFNAVLHSSDGLSIAVANGFTLTNGDTLLSNLAVLTFNLPMFEEQALEIRKTTDRAFGVIGDIVTYNVAVTNKTSALASNTTITDKMPGGFRLAEPIAQLQRTSGITTIPVSVVAGVATFQIGNLAAHETVTIQYRSIIGPDVHVGLLTNTAYAQGTFPTGEVAKSPEAKATVRVTGGVFSDKQAILGRVFEDLNQNGYYDKDADRPVKGARIYTSSGLAVITDENGHYSLPNIDPGSVVISLDPQSLPKGATLIDEGLKYQNSWTRLVQHPLLAGTIMRQNFGLNPLNWTAKEPETANIAKRPCENEKDFDCRMKKLRLAATQKLHTEADTAAGRTNEEETKIQIREEAAQKLRIQPNSIILPRYKTGDVVMSRGLDLEVRVAQGNTVKVEIEGQSVNHDQIGQKKTDPTVGYSSYVFNGLTLKPGPNTVTIHSLNGNTETASQTISLYGRGPLHKISFRPARPSMTAGGRDVMEVAVEGLDEWGNPASDDDQIAVQASAGVLLQLGATYDPNKYLLAKDLTRSQGLSVEQTPEITNTISVRTTDGVAAFQYIAPAKAGLVRFEATNGGLISRFDLNINPEVRPTIMVGIGKISVGAAAPEHQLTQDDKKVSGYGELFLKTNLGDKTSFTGAYNSSKPLNRLGGLNGLFESNPTDNLYPIFGDASTRYREAQSNSKLYFKLEHGQQYAMFGDYQLLGNEAGNYRDSSVNTTTRLGGAFGSTFGVGSGINAINVFNTNSGPQLSTYNRLLTGGKVHIEANKNTYLTLAGARPASSYARDFFKAGILGYQRLSYGNILPNTEQIFIEYRDRRNPEVILKTESLVRGVDYQLDYITGVIFLQRQISQFDSFLNLIQLVALYEYNDGGRSSNVYAGRAGFGINKLGLNLGGTYINQEQAGFSPFRISGFDLEKSLYKGGKLTAEWSRTSGEVAGAGNFFGTIGGFHRGNAYRAELIQPLTSRARFHGLFTKSEEGYLNPFGGTVTPGAQRLELSVNGNLTKKDDVNVSYTDEKNKTVNVNNERQSLEANWRHSFGEKLNAGLGYSYRHLTNNATTGSSTTTNSQMATASLEWTPIPKLSLQVQREQNLTSSQDQTYPNQWVAGAKYQLNQFTNLFFTSRRGSGAIIPIADLSGTGFASTNSRSELAFGVETKIFRNTSFVTRYQIENAINSTDSFAVLGLGQRIPINKVFSLDATFERGFQISGPNTSFTSGSLGLTYAPSDEFKSSVRYELRDKQGFGQIISAGAAGKLNNNLSALGQFQMSDTSLKSLNGQTIDNMILVGRAALAWRPAESDRSGLLFSYTASSFDRGRLPGDASNGLSFTLNKEMTQDFSTDAYYQLHRKLEVFGRAAYRHVGNSGPTVNSVTTDTYLFQGRIQNRFARYFDAALETRYLGQMGFGDARFAYGAELGVWAIQDLRFGLGYNMSDLTARYGYTGPTRKGFYFTVTTKLSNLFNLFGTSPDQLQRR